MNNSIWQQKIPTLFGFIAILIGVFATSFLSQNTTIFQGRAGASEDPKNVRISNITDTSFTVSYQTDGAVVGSLLFGKDQNAKVTALDDQDTKGVSSHKTHYITVKNLDPTTPYFFSIVSGGKNYSSNNQPFQITTGPTLSEASTAQPITGSLVLPNGRVPTEGIVYLTTNSTSPLSAFVQKDGTYTIPVQLLRNQDLNSLATLSNSTFTLLAISDVLSSHVTISFDTTTVPTITLSKDYDFTVGETPLATTSATLGFPTLLTTSAAATEPDIVSPKKDEQFTDQKPLFKGTALPNSKVTLTIQSQSEITTEVSADGLGNWSYRPDANLAPGTHTITMQSKDKFGILRTITQSFTVFASGSQVNESATPSALQTFTPSVSPTLTPTIAPTAEPTPTEILPAQPTPPVSGDSTGIMLGIGAIASTFLGFLIFLGTHGKIPL